MLHVLFSVYLKMLVLYSPFFVLSCFISLTRGYSGNPPIFSTRQK
ncbi:MAG: hypothetical protein GAK32_01365 [Pseudomonas fluorescens]|nr:MAG: hypothetical protein GAK32_01365 [Pseudomonas fluorescens]